MANDILAKIKNNIRENKKTFMQILMESHITIIMLEEADIKKNSKLDFLNMPFMIIKENVEIRKRIKNYILKFLIQHETK